MQATEKERDRLEGRREREEEEKRREVHWGDWRLGRRLPLPEQGRRLGKLRQEEGKRESKSGIPFVMWKSIIGGFLIYIYIYIYFFFFRDGNFPHFALKKPHFARPVKVQIPILTLIKTWDFTLMIWKIENLISSITSVACGIAIVEWTDYINYISK